MYVAQIINEHYGEAAGHFADAASILMNPGEPTGFSPTIGAVVAVVAVLFLARGSGSSAKGAGKTKSSSGGMSPVLLIAVAVVGFLLISNGALSGVLG